MSDSKQIAVIGGGAAGCFAAVCIKRRLPEAAVTIYEAQDRLMVKLSRTGGGRCNITNSFEGIGDIREVYPRGGSLMKKALKEFGAGDTLRWFRKEGLEFYVQGDGRVFPTSGDARDVVRALENALRREGVGIRLNSPVSTLTELGAEAVLLSCGGLSKVRAARLEEEGLRVEEPIASLFAFKISDPALKALSGISVPDASLALPGGGIKARGPLLLTDWGISGPACLRLSSYSARLLSEKNYRSPLLVNWLSLTEDQARLRLSSIMSSQPRKQLSSVPPEGIAGRLWEMLIEKSGLNPSQLWGELGKKGLNRLCAELISSEYEISGKAPYKEEFVTCGGVSLEDVNSRTLESKTCPGLFFAGEVLDIDAVTGGFNLQAAWSTGWLAAKGIEEWIRKS